jgi:hypothetical protein
MIWVIAGGRGVEIVIATTGAGIEKTGMTAGEIAMTGVTGIAMIGTIGADVVGVQREWAGIINRLSQGVTNGIISCRGRGVDQPRRHSGLPRSAIRGAERHRGGSMPGGCNHRSS